MSPFWVEAGMCLTRVFTKITTGCVWRMIPQDTLLKEKVSPKDWISLVFLLLSLLISVLFWLGMQKCPSLPWIIGFDGGLEERFAQVNSSQDGELGWFLRVYRDEQSGLKYL